MPTGTKYDWAAVAAAAGVQPGAPPVIVPPPVQPAETQPATQQDAAPAQSVPQPPAPKTKYDWGEVAAQAKAAQPPAQQGPPPIRPDKNTTPWYARNMLQMAGGPSMVDLMGRILKDPRSQGKDPGYAAELAYEMAKWPAEFVDNILTPEAAGPAIGLAALHAFPATAPFALMGDVALGARQAIHTAGDVENLFVDHSPKAVADTLKDAAYSALFLKGASGGIRDLSSDTSITRRSADVQKQLLDLEPAYSATAEEKTAARKAQENVLSQAGVPASRMEAAFQKIYNLPDITGIPNLAKMTGAVPFTTKMQMARDVIKDNASNKNYQNVVAKSFTNALRNDTTAGERGLMPMAEIIQDPDSLGMTTDEISDKYDVSKDTAKWVQAIRAKNETGVKVGDVDYGGDVPYMKAAHGTDKLPLQNPSTYVHQSWDFDKTNARFDDIMNSSKAGMSAEDIAAQLGVKPSAVQDVIDSGGAHIGPNDGSVNFKGVRSIKDPALRRRALARAFDDTGSPLTDEDGKPLGPRTYKEGADDFLWIPKFNDMADLLDHRYASMIETAENHRTKNILRSMGALRPANSAPENWPNAPDVPALQRMQYLGKIEGGINKQGVKGKDATMLASNPEKIDPDLYPAADILFGSRGQYRDPVTGNLSILGKAEVARGWSKGTQTMGTLFHNWSIMSQYASESMANLSPRNLLRSSWFLNPDWWGGVKNSIFEMSGKDANGEPSIVRENPDVAFDPVKHGMTLSTADAEAPFIKYLKNLDGTGIVPKGGRIAGGALSLFNKPTFDFYLKGAKLNTYYSILNRELPKLGLSADIDAITDLKKTIAEHVDRSFSTESMDSMLLSPQTQKVLSFGLFAPTWALGNVRQLTAGWENATGRALKTRSIAGGLASYWLASNLANYATTSWASRDAKGNHTWQGRWTWQNPGLPAKIAGKTYPNVSENSGSIYDGKNDDGSDRYVTYGKPKMDGFTWLQDPWNTALGRMNSLPRAALEMISHYAPGTDYKTIKTSSDGATPAEQAVEYGMTAAQPFVPFIGEHYRQEAERALIPKVQPEPITSSTGFMFLPASKGTTYEKIKEAFIGALQDTDPVSRSSKIKQIQQVGSTNGINVKSAFEQANQVISSRSKTERGPLLKYDPGSQKMVRRTPPPQTIQ